MFVAKIPNRNSPPSFLLRESYREGGKVKSRTVGNITSLPDAQIAAIAAILRGGKIAIDDDPTFEIMRSRPHGHVAAVLGTLKKLELHELIDRKPSRSRDLVLAMIVARVLFPNSKLATARGLGEETLISTLAESLGVESASEDELYEAMDWLAKKQEGIESRLARKHLASGSLVLYDVSSTYFEGRCCPLAHLGHNRDKKKGRAQIVFGLLCNDAGIPVAVEVFKGNTGDPKTFSAQVEKVRSRFGLERVVFVGDRGMITSARIEKDLKPVGLDWVTALRAKAIQQLRTDGSLQLSLFDRQNLAEIADPKYPGERLVVCRNPLLADERARKREDLLRATERDLEKIGRATQRKRRPLRGKDDIALRVGKVLGRFKMGKHFALEIAEDGFSFRRRPDTIAQEAVLDGFYVIRTSLSAEAMSAEGAVRTYKSLSQVEQAFRCYKSIDLKVRPVYHHLEERVRSHVFLCMLAYYVERHMKEALAPLLFQDEEPAEGEKRRRTVVDRAMRSFKAIDKVNRKRTVEGTRVHSFRTLLADLGTVVRNRVRTNRPGSAPFDLLTTPTPLQQRALDLLGVPFS